MAPKNRRLELEGSTTLVGIDFVEVDPVAQVDLWVYFIGAPGVVFQSTPAEFTQEGGVRIESLSPASTLPTVPVVSVAWEARNGRDVLHVVTERPGDFSRYALTLFDTASPPRVDPYFNPVEFRFQAGCRSDLDCAPEDERCPPISEPDVAIDYTARDFNSFRRALMELASVRWPKWTDRLEADVGVMLAEVMAALADEMAYYQDRVARESSLVTATQRRSLRHHARLLDYEPHDGLAAWTWIRVTVDAGLGAISIPAGTQVRTVTTTDPATSAIVGERVIFELGRGLTDTHPASGAPVTYDVREAWNEIAAWIWDEGETCLPAGSTEVSVEGRWASGANALWTGANRWVLLQTHPEDASVPARAHVVKLTGAEEIWDPLLGVWVTRLRWGEDEATPWGMDLGTLKVHPNLVPAVAGRTVPAAGAPDLLFRVRNKDNPDPPPGWTTSPPEAVERTGPNGTVCYLLPLLETEREALCFTGESPAAAVPEILVELLAAEGDPTPTRWRWLRSLLGSPAALGTDEVYTLEDGLWDEVARYHRGEPEPRRHVDYRTGAGFTVRFGDGSLGAIPDPDAVFRVIYRVGGGSAANVGAGTLVETSFAGITVTNPLPVTTGVDPETAREVRTLAPEAWKAVTYRAVRPEDYAEALERLPWVQRSGAHLRWTGSWLTLFGTPDPRAAVTLTAAQRADAEAQLDRFRQAGREAHVLDPVYAWIDLRITVCVEPSSFRGDVQAAVTRALFGAQGRGGFFDPDNFTFGVPLRRSALYAAIQAVPGVRAVEGIQIRRRGHFGWREFTEEALSVGLREVIGVANDPLYPERGAVTFTMEGGA